MYFILGAVGKPEVFLKRREGKLGFHLKILTYCGVKNKVDTVATVIYCISKSVHVFVRVRV